MGLWLRSGGSGERWRVGELARAGILPTGLALAALGAGVSLATWAPSLPAEAHQDGCHRWHTCPPDTPGAYVCGDIPGHPCGGTTNPTRVPQPYSATATPAPVRSLATPTPSNAPVASAPPIPPVDVGSLAPSSKEPSPLPNDAQGNVVAAIGGDAIAVEVEGALYFVRYLGIVAPEILGEAVGQCYGALAETTNRQLVVGQAVRLEADSVDRDSKGRFLRYVWIGDTLMNARLLFEGAAVTDHQDANLRYGPFLAEMERQARLNQAGIWGACPQVLPTPVAGPGVRSSQHGGQESWPA